MDHIKQFRGDIHQASSVENILPLLIDDQPMCCEREFVA